MTPQRGQLCLVECRTVDLANVPAELGRRDGRHTRGDVGLGVVQQGQVRIKEVVALLDGLDLVKRRVTSPNNGDGALGDVRAIPCGEVFGVTQWLESLDHDGPGGVAGRLEVDEQVQRLAGRSVEDAVRRSARFDEWRRRVFALHNVQDRLDVQRVQCARGREGGLFVAHEQRVVV